MSSYTTDVKELPNGEFYIEFTDEIMKEVGWKEGDVLNWKDNKDGSFTLTKKEETEWVLVETLSQFKVSYMVEVPKGKAVYALDTVAMEQAKEFSQEHLLPSDIVIGHRVVTEEEALKLCDERNDYISTWNDETKMKNFFTSWEEQNGTE